MKLRILYFGRSPSWVNDAVETYQKRLPELTLIRVRESSKFTRFEQLQRNFGSSISVMLDERGTQFTTAELASQLQRWRMDGKDVSFLIGDSDGFSSSERDKVNFLWSLSSLTLPYSLARLIVCEQLYRAHSILNGHPYHRDESR